jgi:glucosamine--fructose-6-phosphate aminotransferase (isomerizing)
LEPKRRRLRRRSDQLAGRTHATIGGVTSAPPTTDSVMYQTMHRQPADVRRLLEAPGWAAATEAADRISAARRIYTVGIGTSYHAALVGAWLLRAAGSDARAASSFDFANYTEAAELSRDDAVLIMAHSGVKQYSTASLQRAASVGAARISVGSLTAEHEGSQQVLRTVERERSAAFTSSHMAAMTVLAQIATALGEGRGAAGVAGFRDALGALPENVEDALAREDAVLPIAKLAASRRIYAIGGGPNETTALEAVIKVREAAQGWIDGLPVEQFLHGPLVAANADDIGVVIQVEGQATARVAEVARVLEAIGVRLWVVGRPIADVSPTAVFELADMPEVLSPLLTVVGVQLLAYQLAVVRGINPDVFRRDDPKYAAALGLLKL